MNIKKISSLLFLALLSIFATQNLDAAKSHYDKMLIKACDDNDITKAEEALKNNANPNIQHNPGWGSSCLEYACIMGYTDLAKLLLDYKADPNLVLPKSEKTCLWQAAHKGHEDIVKLLLEYKADVNKTSCECKWTPLMAAVSPVYTLPGKRNYGTFLNIVKMLVQNGAHINQKETYFGTTALDEIHKKCYNYISLKECKEIEQFLIEKGAKKGSELPDDNDEVSDSKKLEISDNKKESKIIENKTTDRKNLELTDLLEFFILGLAMPTTTSTPQWLNIGSSCCMGLYTAQAPRSVDYGIRMAAFIAGLTTRLYAASYLSSPNRTGIIRKTAALIARYPRTNASIQWMHMTGSHILKKKYL